MDTNDRPSNIPNTEPPPPGSESYLPTEKDSLTPKANPVITKMLPSIKGVENAKKRLRAFSIQKKTPLSPVIKPKTVSTGNTTVLIGKLNSVKVTPKIEDPEQKKQPKPPKPGTSRRTFQDSYTDLQKRTLAEIEDMKRKMELVELGIPLGLICPTSTSEKAMPTKAMPPIKSFLDPRKVDEIIREAKKAKIEGKEFKFNYQKLLPGYDNPFQRKKDEYDKERKSNRRKGESEKDKDRRRSDKYSDSRRYECKKEDTKYKERNRDKNKEKNKESFESNSKHKEKPTETDVNLNDYLVCDSWSLNNDDKSNVSVPKEQGIQLVENKVVEPSEQLKASIAKKKEILKACAVDNPKNISVKIEKLHPVIDSFKFEIDPSDEVVLDIFDEDSNLEKFAQQKTNKKHSLYDATDKNVVDYNVINTKDTSMDGLNDDTFLESVINEIKQEDMSDDHSHDKGLVEYDISPGKEESPKKSKQGSVTPEMLENVRSQSQKSDYSEGYRSSDSFKTDLTSESGYKSAESYRLSVERELDDALQSKMSKSTVDSLEIWSYVLKICQPLLFRHDKKECYKETRSLPKMWFTENPKVCSCVKDRSLVYEELEMCKMNLVDRVYGCDQISDFPCANVRSWYPRNGLTSMETTPLTLSNEWETEDSQHARPNRSNLAGLASTATPQKSDEMSLDREYQRFMESVWPEGSDAKTEMSRSTTPVRQEIRKKKKEEDKDVYEKRTKKLKLSSEGWSQESDIEDEDDKCKKVKVDKVKSKTRKRKHSSSSSSSSLSDSDEDSRKKAKIIKKKALKKIKSKSAKRRRMGRKILKKLKQKERKRKLDKDSDDDSSKKNGKKSKKKKQLKLKRRALKKKKAKRSGSSSSSSSDSSSDSDSESDRRSRKIKKSKLGKKKIRKERISSSDSSQSEELFDVNILNNIKTERLTDDEKCQKLMEFSPRRQKPREIINVKELQHDFVENIHIKKEIEEPKSKDSIQSDVFDIGNIDSALEGCKELNKEMSDSSQGSEEIPLPPAPEPATAPAGAPSPHKPTPPTPVAPPQEMSDSSQGSEEIPLPPAPEPAPAPSPHKPTPQNLVALIPTPPAPVAHPQVSDLQYPAPLTHTQSNQISAPEESNMSQCSSQESVCSLKEEAYEKDESHLRPSSQNSNYSFNDVMASHSGHCGTYDLFEQHALAYQNDVATQSPGAAGAGEERRIETVVRSRCGEIKCDWRAEAAEDTGGAGETLARPSRPARPSRWGLKPGEVNIVLTGGGALYPPPQTVPTVQRVRTAQTVQPAQTVQTAQTVQSAQTVQTVYQIQSIANRTDISGYDEAYMDMYGASDRLQYGDCFSADFGVNSVNTSVNIDVTDTLKNTAMAKTRTSTLDARIDQALKTTILGEVAKEAESETDKDIPEKGILITGGSESRGSKRVSFADGYKPGQDSDVEDPPVKRRKKTRRVGCAWPCAASHPDHVPLWDALPPPPPPPGSPPPPARPPPPPAHLLRLPAARPRAPPSGLPPALPPEHPHKFEPPVPLQGFMPPEPPPGLIALQ